jgi:hypothetical protein
MFAASNPAKVRVMVMHFLKCDMKDLIILVAAIVLSGGLLVVNWKLALIILGIAVFVVGFSISQAKQVFSEGDVCPAIVVDSQKKLVAVFTSLSKTPKPHYVVKVLKQPLGRLPGGPFPEGKRLAFVAMYNGFPQEPLWKNFGGYLVNTGTTSKKTIQRVVSSIPDQQWKRLEKAINQLEAPPQAGLFEV